MKKMANQKQAFSVPAELEIKTPTKANTKKTTHLNNNKPVFKLGQKNSKKCRVRLCSREEKHAINNQNIGSSDCTQDYEGSGRRSGRTVLSRRIGERPPDNDRLLEDRTISYHAWSLWASDQRRPFQQENPDADHEEMEARLRRHWENVSKRERLKYCLRAFSAQCRSTSSYRKDGAHNVKTSAISVDLETFCSASKRCQQAMVQNAIQHLQRKLPEPYFEVLLRTLHCTRGANCLVQSDQHAIFSGLASDRVAACHETRSGLDVIIPSHLVWHRLCAEEACAAAINRQYAKWRLTTNRLTCSKVIECSLSASVKQPLEDTPQSGKLDQLLADLADIEVSADSRRSVFCEKGHDLVSQIAEDLEASTTHVFRLGDRYLSVPAVGNKTEAIAVMVRALSNEDLPVFSAEDVAHCLDCPESPPSVRVLSEVLDLLQGVIQVDIK